MGLFDTIDIDVRHLPILPATGEQLPTSGWQTKDLGESLAEFRLTADGALECHAYPAKDPNAPDRGLPCGWRPTIVGADIAVYRSVEDAAARHPDFPDARRFHWVELICPIRAGRLEGQINIACVRETWMEQINSAFRQIETDPQRRVVRAEQDRLAAIRADLEHDRAHPGQILRHFLARHLGGRELECALRLVRRVEDAERRPRRAWRFSTQQTPARGIRAMIESLEPPRA